jgi:glycosyltransferase involved in cell wall biosynthesis
MLRLPRLTPQTVQFVLLSFEGPDQYAMAGGLGTRMKELGLELARLGYDTHHVFVGDPELPATSRPLDNLTLHRWCQWLSAHHPQGVYDGEESKLSDWNATLPAFVVEQLVRPAAAQGRLTAVIAEEWHTAESTCTLSDQLWSAGLRDKTMILWNANNLMGFDRIDWERLDYCSAITTVSRYMKHLMWALDVNPLVIANGIPEERIRRMPVQTVKRLRAAVGAEEVLFKIGRWSPDKRWNMAVEALAEERRRGRDISMVIRGGIEPHALEVLQNARDLGLEIVEIKLPRHTNDAIDALAELPRGDIVNVQSFMSDELVSLFYAGADAVLANSGHEPFGLVGLEVMAASGVAFVGSTGEDYAIPYLNAIVLDSDDPTEITIALDFLRSHPDVPKRIRKEARLTAQRFTWGSIIEDTILGRLSYVALRQKVQTADPPAPAAAGPDSTRPAAPEAADVAPAAGTPESPSSRRKGKRTGDG